MSQTNSLHWKEKQTSGDTKRPTGHFTITHEKQNRQR